VIFAWMERMRRMVRLGTDDSLKGRWGPKNVAWVDELVVVSSGCILSLSGAAASERRLFVHGDERPVIPNPAFLEEAASCGTGEAPPDGRHDGSPSCGHIATTHHHRPPPTPCHPRARRAPGPVPSLPLRRGGRGRAPFHVRSFLRGSCACSSSMWAKAPCSPVGFRLRRSSVSPEQGVVCPAHHTRPYGRGRLRGGW
jgi:hypothetical protein